MHRCVAGRRRKHSRDVENHTSHIRRDASLPCDQHHMIVCRRQRRPRIEESGRCDTNEAALKIASDVDQHVSRATQVVQVDRPSGPELHDDSVWHRVARLEVDVGSSGSGLTCRPHREKAACRWRDSSHVENYCCGVNRHPTGTGDDQGASFSVRKRSKGSRIVQSRTRQCVVAGCRLRRFGYYCH